MITDNRKPSVLTYFRKHKYLYLMLIPGILYYAVFCYGPMYGAIMAFKDFNPLEGIISSPWVGFKYFKQLFLLDKFYDVFFNTLSISFTRLLFGFPFPILIALLLNEMKRGKLRDTIQTAIYIPNFISWVVLGGIMVNLLSVENGAVNAVIRFFGGKPIGFLSDEKYFIPTLVVSMIWKTFGYNTIIYFAALTGIDSQLYEAAKVDGAGRFRQLIYITIPGIIPIIVVMFIMRIGNIMQAGFEQVFVLYHPGVYGTADIIDTYVYRIGLQEGKFEFSAAIGLFKSVINFILILVANRLARIAGEEGVY